MTDDRLPLAELLQKAEKATSSGASPRAFFSFSWKPTLKG